jgi:hypothetical protein
MKRGDALRNGVHEHHALAIKHELESRARAVVQRHLGSDPDSLAPQAAAGTGANSGQTATAGEG